MSEQFDILADQDAAFGDEGTYNNMDNFDWESNVQDSWTNPSFSSGDQWNNLNTEFNPNGTQDQWGAGGYQMNNDGTQFWQNQAGDYVGYQEPGGQFTPYNTNTGIDMGSVSNTLAELFNSKGGQFGMKMLGALMEGQQNKKQASALQKVIQQQRQVLDPFGSQRPYYQQQLQNTVQDPYNQPMVRSQVDQLARAQAIKDAAAGRRSNGATSSPALLAAQAQVAQQYMNSLMQPAGAGIGPTGLSSLTQPMADAARYETNGTLSPLMSALGMTQKQNNNTDVLSQLLQAMQQSKAGA